MLTILELDDWSTEYTTLIEKTGNFICNSIWEGVPVSPDFKPDQSASREERESFIREKYENKAFLMPLPSKYEADLSMLYEYTSCCLFY